MAVSTSFGGNFKVWVQSSSLQPSNEKNQSGWRCQSVGSYKKKPMTAAAFSADGSVLAVAAESVITLWDPDNNALVGVIAEALSPVTKLSFIGTSAFLMSVSQSSRPQVAVWNVSNLSMQWSYSLFAEAACCSSSRGSAAVPTSCTGSSSATSASSTSTQRSARKRGRWQQTSSTKLPAWPPYLVIFVLPWMLSEPDIAAPGVNILAAVAQLGNFKEFGAPYYLLSGTSMSCPHVSGIMALLKSFHPNWSPAALKSALMTTALVTDSNGLPLLASGTPTKIADPFDYGAGFVNPNQASDPGLIYDINPSDYQKLFNCTGGSDIDSSCPTIERSLLDLNPPSIAIPNLKTSKTVSRTVTNVGQPDAVYKAFFDPPTGVDMLVEPLMLVFGKNTTSQSFKVTFKATRKVQGDYAFGSLVWQ